MHNPDNNYEEKIIGWIDKNRTLPGQKILCIGTGVEPARHLARLFPSSQVVCLTDSKYENTGENSLREPILIEKDASSYDGGSFDTVIACSDAPLLPEHPADSFPRWERGTFYLRKASLLMEYYEEQAHLPGRHLKPGGTLFNLVQSERDEYLLGYCLALAAEELSVDPSSIRRILCRRGGKRLVLHGIIAFAGGRTDIQSLIAGSLNDSLDRMNTTAPDYEGRDAEIMLQPTRIEAAIAQSQISFGVLWLMRREIVGSWRSSRAIVSSTMYDTGFTASSPVAGSMPPMVVC